MSNVIKLSSYERKVKHEKEVQKNFNNGVARLLRGFNVKRKDLDK